MIGWNARRAWLCVLGAGWLLPWTAAAEEGPPVPVIAWQDARDYLGREVEVVGKVIRAHKSGPGNVFLNFAEDWKGTLDIYIPKAVVSQFPQAPDQLYQGKMVKIRGRVKDFRGNPSLTVTGPGDVTVLPDDAPHVRLKFNLVDSLVHAFGGRRHEQVSPVRPAVEHQRAVLLRHDPEAPSRHRPARQRQPARGNQQVRWT